MASRGAPHSRASGQPLSESERGLGGEVRVELFGLARLAAGRKAVALELPHEASLLDLLAALAGECPALVGKAVRPDLAGLVDGYVFNLNGASFVRDLSARLSPGDSVLLLSNEAGG